jgi:hypothetical protein
VVERGVEAVELWSSPYGANLCNGGTISMSSTKVEVSSPLLSSAGMRRFFNLHVGGCSLFSMLELDASSSLRGASPVA